MLLWTKQEDTYGNACPTPALGFAVGPSYRQLWVAGELSMIGAGDWISVSFAPRIFVMDTKVKPFIIGAVGGAYASRTAIDDLNSTGIALGVGGGAVVDLGATDGDWRAQNISRIERLEAAYRAECLDSQDDQRCELMAEETEYRLKNRDDCRSTPPEPDPYTHKLNKTELLETRLYLECRSARMDTPSGPQLGLDARWEYRRTDLRTSQGVVFAFVALLKATRRSRLRTQA